MASWRDRLVYVHRRIANCAANVATILINDPQWKGVLVYDEFAHVIRTVKEPAWDEADRPGPGVLNEVWTDGHTARVGMWMSRKYQFVAGDAAVLSGVRMVAQMTPVHPIRDLLEGLEWDGTDRIDTYLSRLARAEDTPYTRAVSARWLIAAVARIFVPGVKCDNVMILEGPQGIGKSTLLRLLSMRDEWFLETAVDLGSKDSYQIIAQKWLVELSELDSLTRSEISRTKAFITSTHDTFRVPYGHVPETIGRQCLFAGTTNGSEYLKDDSGARRFWPVLIGTVKLKSLKKERRQLWAEAVTRFKKGEKWHIHEPELIAAAAAIAEERRQPDPWEQYIHRFLIQNARYSEKGISIPLLLEKIFKMPAERQGRGEQIRVGIILRKLGWTPHRGTDGVRRYRPNQ